MGKKNTERCIWQDNQGRIYEENENGDRIMRDRELPPALLAAAMLQGPEMVDNLLAASTPGGIEAQEARKQRELVQSEQLPIKLGSPQVMFDKLGFKFGRTLDKMLQEGTLPEGWKKVRDPGHSMYSYVLDQKGRRRWTIFFKGAFYDYEAFGWGLHRRFEVRVEKDHKYEGNGQRPIWGEIHDNGVLFDPKAKEGRYVMPKIIYRSQEPFFTPKDWDHSDRIEKMVRLEMEMWIEANFPKYEDPLAYWD